MAGLWGEVVVGGGGGDRFGTGGQDPINTFNFYHWKEEMMKQIVP